MNFSLIIDEINIFLKAYSVRNLWKITKFYVTKVTYNLEVFMMFLSKGILKLQKIY